MKYQIGATTLSWFITHNPSNTTCFFEWSEPYESLLESLKRLRGIPDAEELFMALERHKTVVFENKGFWKEGEAFHYWHRILQDVSSCQSDVFPIRVHRLDDATLHVYNQHIDYAVDMLSQEVKYAMFDAYFDDYDPLMYASFEGIIDTIRNQICAHPEMMILVSEKMDFPSLTAFLTWLQGYDHAHSYQESELHL